MFKIRKYAEVDYLLRHSFRWYFRQSVNKPFQPPFFQRWLDAYGKEMNNDYSRDKDCECVEISCTFNEEYSEFELSFKCVVKDSGLYLKDKLLYEAPAEGYLKEATFKEKMVDPNENEWHRVPLFLYIKGPGAKYYSRIDLKFSTCNTRGPYRDPTVQLMGEIFTNPQGRRSLEYDAKFIDNEKMFRYKIKKERRKAKFKAIDKKKKFDEKAFKKEVDAKHPDRDHKKLGL